MTAKMVNMLTTGEVARIFNVSPATVRRWCREGKLETVRKSARGQLRFRREEVATVYLDRSLRRYLKGQPGGK
jgi:excisionase family DNA binding protein